jgi:hypothetical protein
LTQVQCVVQLVHQIPEDAELKLYFRDGTEGRELQKRGCSP